MKSFKQKIFILAIFIQIINNKSNEEIESQEEKEETYCFDLDEIQSKGFKKYPELQQFNIDDFKEKLINHENNEFIDEGGNGKIYKIQLKEKKNNKLSEELALKVQTVTINQIHNIEEEVGFHYKLLGIKGIPDLYGCFYNYKEEEDTYDFFIVQQLLAYNVYQPLKIGKSINQKNIHAQLEDPISRYTFYKSLFVILAEISELGIVHNDIKPGNIMVDEDGYQNGPYIIDYGQSTYKGDRAKETTECYEFLNKSNTLQNQEQLDVYSMAVSILELEWGIERVCLMFWAKSRKYNGLKVNQQQKELFKKIVEDILGIEEMIPSKKKEKRNKNLANCDSLQCILRFCLQENLNDIPKASEVSSAFDNIILEEMYII